MPRKTKVGKVVSDKNAKTIVVEVHRRKKHPRYHKYIQERKRFMAHDEAELAAVGDIVRIVESRPLSARKRWMLDAVITRGVGPEVEVKYDEDLAVALGQAEEPAQGEGLAEEAEGEEVELTVQVADEAAVPSETGAGAGSTLPGLKAAGPVEPAEVPADSPAEERVQE